MDKNLYKFMAFVKTVESGSFTKAAEILNYTQSAISRMISDLENEWHITLLERGKNGVSLTSDGLRLYSYCVNVCNEYNKLELAVDELKGLEKGIIRIGAFSSVATHWIPKIVKKFQQDYPKIDYEILLGDYLEIAEWIKNGRIDCGFTTIQYAQGFDNQFLEKDELCVIIPKNHPLSDYGKIPIKELEKYPFLLLDKNGLSDCQNLFNEHKIKPQIHYTTWDDYSIMAMVESDLGVSILPKLILNRIPYNIEIKSLNVPAFRDICVAMRDKNTISKATKVFLNYLHYSGCSNINAEKDM